MPGYIERYVSEQRSRDERDHESDLGPTLAQLRQNNEPIIATTDRILDYAAQSPIKREALNFMLESQRGDLLNQGLGEVESWEQAAKNIRQQLNEQPNLMRTDAHAQYMIQDTREVLASREFDRAIDRGEKPRDWVELYRRPADEMIRTERVRDREEMEIGGR